MKALNCWTKHTLLAWKRLVIQQRQSKHISFILGVSQCICVVFSRVPL